MTEQDRDEIRRITMKDPASVLAALRPYIPPPQRRQLMHAETDVRYALEAQDPES